MSDFNTNRHVEAARQHMVTRVPTATAGESTSAVFARLAGVQFDDAGAVYVLDARGRLDGLVPITVLFESAQNLGDWSLS